MLKLACGSQEQIIDFVEKSAEYSKFNRHYIHLLTHADFELELKKISAIAAASTTQTCLILLDTEQKEQLAFINQLSEHLRLAGVVVRVEPREKTAKIFADLQKNEAAAFSYIVHCVYVKNIADFQMNDCVNTFSISRKIEQSLFLLPESRVVDKIVQNQFSDLLSVDLSDPEQYYFWFFETLMKLLKLPELAKNTLEFKLQYQKLLDPSHSHSKQHDEPKVVDIKSDAVNGIKSSQKTNVSFSKGVLLALMLLMANVLVFNKAIVNGLQDTSLGMLLARIYSAVKGDSIHIVNASSKMENSDAIPELKTAIQREKIQEIQELAGRLNAPVILIGITGFPGTGKTVLAQTYSKHYIEAHPENTKSIRWYIRAERESTRQEDYRALARKLAINFNNETQISDLASKVNHKLLEYPGFILIFDNVTNYEDIAALIPHDSKFSGETKLHGQVIITSRDNNIIPLGKPASSFSISLNKGMSDSEAIALMSNLTGKKSDKVLIEIVKRLGGLPLALTQAASYINEAKLDFSEYLKLYDEQYKNLLIQQKLPMTYLDVINHAENIELHSENTYDVVLKFSINKISTPAQELLYLAAYMDPNNIPVEIFSHLELSEEEIASRITELEQFSLITPSFGGHHFSVHRVIQDLAKVLIKEKQLIQNYETQCIDRVLELIHYKHREGVYTEHDYFDKRYLISHLEKALQAVDPAVPYTMARIQGMVDLAILYKATGNAKLATNYFQQIAPLVSGMDNDLAAEVYKSLGRSHQGSGNFEEAKIAYDKAYAIYQKHKKENTAEFTEILNDLGMIYRDMGEEGLKTNVVYAHSCFNKALDYLNQAVDINKKLANQQKNRIRYLTNLGEIQRELGDAEGAEKTLYAALNLSHKEFPSQKHRLIASAYFNLGRIYTEQSRFQEAKLSFEKAVGISSDENVAGKNHPLTARHTDALGMAWRKLGFEKEACHFFREAHSILESGKRGQKQLKHQILEHVTSCKDDIVL